MGSIRERLGLALRAPLDRMQLPGTRIVVERLLAGSNGTIEAKLATGVRMRLDLGDRIQRLEAFRAYERRELSLVRSLLRPGDVVIDVGAHVGYYALHAARRVGPSGEVHAFEPVGANAARLRENIELNGFRNVVVNECAAGASAGRARFGVVKIEGESGWSSLLVAGRETADDIEIDVVTLDDYVVSASLPTVSFIKIDVQGNELDVLRGAASLLERFGPDVMCEAEVYWLEATGRSPAELLGFMRGLGYRAWGVPARGPAALVRGDELPSLNLFFTKRSTLERGESA
ncbi:MAG: FkbM family methyltransferase [Actinobacteria bacterium]|nr:FkbM family methyltransferase [Actinomycetota bacterium]